MYDSFVFYYKMIVAILLLTLQTACAAFSAERLNSSNNNEQLFYIDALKPPTLPEPRVPTLQDSRGEAEEERQVRALAGHLLDIHLKALGV